jgi:hypothetical protein
MARAYPSTIVNSTNENGRIVEECSEGVIQSYLPPVLEVKMNARSRRALAASTP